MTLPPIPSLGDVATEPDTATKKALAEVERHELANVNERALIALRKSYGCNMIRFLWVYFGFAVALIALDALGLPCFHLADGVGIALIGGTAVSVLGVVGTIVAGLFRVRTD